MGIYGAWGKGASLFEAAQKCKAEATQSNLPAQLLVIIGDSDISEHQAFIDRSGGICFGGTNAPEAKLIDCRCVGTCESIIKQSKKTGETA